MGRHTALTGQGVPAVRLPQPYTYNGRHRAEERGCRCDPALVGHNWRCPAWRLATDRPPSPTYSFTLVEQPGSADHTHACVFIPSDHPGGHRCECGHQWAGIA